MVTLSLSSLRRLVVLLRLSNCDYAILLGIDHVGILCDHFLRDHHLLRLLVEAVEVFSNGGSATRP